MQANYSFHHFPSAALSALSTHKTYFNIFEVYWRERREKKCLGLQVFALRLKNIENKTANRVRKAGYIKQRSEANEYTQKNANLSISLNHQTPTCVKPANNANLSQTYKPKHKQAKKPVKLHKPKTCETS